MSRSLSRFRLAVGAAALLVVAGCSSAVPTDTPGVERLGERVLRYSGPEVEAVLGYRFASQSLGDEWMFLDLAVTGVTGESVEVRREKIFLRSPHGETIPLASQTEFGQAFGGLRSALQRAAIAGDPLDYFKDPAVCFLNLFAAPGEGLAFDSFTVHQHRVCAGRLYFSIPQTIQAGTWVLAIDLPESRVRIPFTLGT
ncbi:MAG: hypothetical protein AB1625_05270 [Acidobacteriota bacterium]